MLGHESPNIIPVFYWWAGCGVGCGVEVEEGLRAGVDVREGVDGSPQECHIASLRKFANELLDQGFLEPDSPRRTRRGSVFA